MDSCRVSMAEISQAAVAFTGTSASDLIRSSNSYSGIPLRSLGRARLGSKKREFFVVAKLRKVKKHGYPWLDNPDPNVKGGVLMHLSHFKPLKEKPKPVTLDFEKPLVALEKKIIDVRRMANETGLDFSDQIVSLENKYQQTFCFSKKAHKNKFQDNQISAFELLASLAGKLLQESESFACRPPCVCWTFRDGGDFFGHPTLNPKHISVHIQR